MGNFSLPLLPGTLTARIAAFANFLERRFKISKMAGSDFRATMAPFFGNFLHRGKFGDLQSSLQHRILYEIAVILINFPHYD